MRRVPLPIANAGVCYLGDNEKSAKCTNDELRSSSQTLVETSRLTVASLFDGNQSLFYLTNGLLVSKNLELSIVLMRLLNLVILMSLLVIAWKSASMGANARLHFALVITSIPVFLFIITSNNSSSWTFLGCAFIWFFVDSLMTQPTSRQRIFALLGLGICVLLCVGSRSESVPFAMMQAVAVCALRINPSWIQLGRIRMAVLSVVATLFAVALILLSGVWRMITSGFSYVYDESPLNRDASSLLVHNIQAVPDLYVGLIGGIRGVGASDTELYGVVRTLIVAVLGFVVIHSLRGASKKSKVLLAGVATLSLAMPLVILQVSNLFVGEELLPRYLYPLFILMVAIALIHSEKKIDLSIGQATAICVALSAVHSIALRQVILRHTLGIEHYGKLVLGQNAEWWWTNLPSLGALVLWALGSLGFFLITRELGRELHNGLYFDTSAARPS